MAMVANGCFLVPARKQNHEGERHCWLGAGGSSCAVWQCTQWSRAEYLWSLIDPAIQTASQLALMIAAAMGGEVAAVKAKAPKVVQPEAESESSEESSDEAPEPVKAPVKGKKQPVKKQAASEGDSEESDEDEEDSEDEEPAPLGKTAGEAESEESESEEEPKPAKKGKVQKASEPAKPAESDEESEGSDEEDAEPVVFIVGANKLGGPTLKKFFKKKGITVKAVTNLDKKTIAVDLIQASDVPKALALSGQDLNGQVLMIQSEASPKKEAGKKDAKKAVKRPASDDEEEEDEEEEEEDDDDEDMEEEDAQAKRKKDKQSGNAAKKQKLNQSAAEEVFTAFIGGLKAESTEDTVKKFLKKKGIEVKVVRKMEGKRFGYVDVCTKEELQEVVALSGQTIDGEAIRVEEAKPKGSTPEKAGRQQRDTSADERTLFVKNIPNSVDEDQLKEFFSEASEVRMPQKDGSHKGFAYIVFPDTETADSVLSEKQGADLEGNALYLDRTGSKSSFSRGDDRRKSTGLRGESTVLFVKNLSYNVDEDTLKEAFPDAVSARIARFADSGKHRGFGFVDFSSPAAASKAYDEKQNTEIDGREVVLDFSSPQGQGGGRGGFRGGRGGFGDRGRGGRGGRGGFRGGRGGYGDRGGRGGRGGFRGGRGGGRMGEPQGKKKRFNDSDSD